MAKKESSDIQTRMGQRLICRFFLCLWAGTLLITTGLHPATAAEIKKGEVHTFETLTLHDETYTNAVVEGVNTNIVFIRHTRGIAMVKIKDLTYEEAKTLGVETMLPPPALPKPDPSKALKEQWEKIANMLGGFAKSGVAVIVLAALLVPWFIWCYCLKRMCRKAGTEAGILIWLPFFQLFPLHQAAHISRLLVLCYFIPIVSLAVVIYWAVKMCEAVGKSKWLALPLLLPVLNLFTVAYLAFSKED